MSFLHDGQTGGRNEGMREGTRRGKDEWTSTHVNGGSDHGAPVVYFSHDGQKGRRNEGRNERKNDRSAG